MSDSLLRPLTRSAAAAILASAAFAGLWGPSYALGVVAGGVWNLTSLWCLVHLLDAGLGAAPSKRRAIGWLLVKFPLLYAIAFAVLHTSAVSVIGFGIGFTAVLLVMAVTLALRTRSVVTPPHGE